MTEEQRMLAEQACAKLVNRFAVHNDACQFDELAALFTEDGRFARPTDPENFTEGRDNIQAAFEARPKDRVTRHVLTNIVVDVLSETEAKGQCYAVLYTASPDNKAPKMGLQANSSQFIGEFFMNFRKTEEGWKIAQQSGNISLAT